MAETPLANRNVLLLAKVETTSGYDAEPDEDNDAIRVADLNVRPLPNVVQTNEASGSLDLGEDIVGSAPMQVTCRTFLRGSGDADTPPDLGVLMRAASLGETINAPNNVTYALTSVKANIPTLTLYAYRDGILWIIVGCRVQSMVMTWPSGQGVSIDWTLQGVFDSHEDAAVPTPATFDATSPPIWLNRSPYGGTFTIGGAEAAVNQLTLTVNNTIVLPDNPNEPEGFDPAVITGRRIEGTMNPNKTLVATRHIFADFRAGTKRAIVAAVGGTAGNIWTLTIPNALYLNDTEGDRDGLAIEDVSYQATGGDAALTLVHT